MATVKTYTKIRVQFEFTPQALERLDALIEETGATTRAETVRAALRLYEWFVDAADRNSIIKVVNENDEIVSQFKAKLLKK